MESSSRFAKLSTSASFGCRLRHQLNSDCQLNIFEYLNLKDLSELCKVDKYFYDLITSQIIAKKLIDIGELDERLPNNRLAVKHSLIESFKMFGKFMKKITVRGEDFSLLLDTVMRYCRPNCLTDIDLEFKLNSADEHLTEQSMPFFNKLRKMRLFDMNADGLYQQFLTKIAEAQNKVEILHLQRVDIADGWLPKMQNLSQLRVHNTRNISHIDDLTGCFKSNPKLRLFEYKGNENLSDTYKTLAAYCPRLQTFSDFHVSNSGCGTEADVTRRYEFLSQFKELQSVTLTSYTETGHDLDHHLRIPSLANISKFRVFVNSDWPIVWNTERIRQVNNSFDKLKTIEIEIRSIGDINCDLRCKFMFHLISQLKNIENVKFIGSGFTNVHNVLRHTSNIRRLSIADIDFRLAHFRHELRNIMRAVGSIPICNPLQERNQKKKFLHLGVNKHQWEEVKLYERIRHVVAASIEKNLKKVISF